MPEASRSVISCVRIARAGLPLYMRVTTVDDGAVPRIACR